MALNAEVDATQWRRVTLTKTGKNTYDAIFENETQKGEGVIEVDLDDLVTTGTDPVIVEEYALGLGDHWAVVAKTLVHRFQCDVVVIMPEGSDPAKVCFYHGVSPWRCGIKREIAGYD